MPVERTTKIKPSAIQAREKIMVVSVGDLSGPSVRGRVSGTDVYLANGPNGVAVEIRTPIHRVVGPQFIGSSEPSTSWSGSPVDGAASLIVHVGHTYGPRMQESPTYEHIVDGIHVTVPVSAATAAMQLEVPIVGLSDAATMEALATLTDPNFALSLREKVRLALRVGANDGSRVELLTQRPDSQQWEAQTAVVQQLRGQFDAACRDSGAYEIGL